MQLFVGVSTGNFDFAEMYPGKPIDPENLSTTSSSEGIIHKETKWGRIQNQLGGLYTFELILPSDTQLIISFLDDQTNIAQGCRQGECDQDNVTRTDHLLRLPGHNHLQYAFMFANNCLLDLKQFLFAVTFSMMNPTMYYQTKIMTDLFLDKADKNGVAFKDASQMDHFWGVSRLT